MRPKSELRPPGLVALLVALSGCTVLSPPDIALSPARVPLVDYALSLQGIPYRYGKESPEEGFDCSGFVRHVYSRNGVPLPRRARDMAAALPPVTIAELRPGDLLFFHVGGKRFSHVGIYVGGDEFVHAPSSRSRHVRVSSLRARYWRQRLAGIRRPLPPEAPASPRQPPGTAGSIQPGAPAPSRRRVME